MSIKQDSMFRRLHTSERKRVLQTLGQQKTEVIAKGSKDDLYTLFSKSFEKDKFLYCQLGKTDSSPAKNQSVVCNFNQGFERYFFQSGMSVGETKVVLEPSEIYVLQRRRTVRMRIPEKYPLANFNCIHMKGKAIFHELRAIDFSSGGVRVFHAGEEVPFEAGDKFLGILHLGKRKPLQMSGIVKHIIKRKLWDVQGQIIGIQFDGLNKTMEIKLLTLFMDLHREIFVKNYKEQID